MVDSTALLDALWNAVMSDDRLLSNHRSFSGIMSAVEWIRSPDSGKSARALIEGGMGEIASFLREAIDRKQSYHQICNYLQLLQKLCEPDNIVEHPGFVAAKKSLLAQLLQHLGEAGAVHNYVLILLKLWQQERVLRETLREFARLLQIEADCVPPDQIGTDEREFFPINRQGGLAGCVPHTYRSHLDSVHAVLQRPTDRAGGESAIGNRGVRNG